MCGCTAQPTQSSVLHPVAVVVVDAVVFQLVLFLFIESTCASLSLESTVQNIGTMHTTHGKWDSICIVYSCCAIFSLTFRFPSIVFHMRFRRRYQQFFLLRFCFEFRSKTCCRLIDTIFPLAHYRLPMKWNELFQYVIAMISSRQIHRSSECPSTNQNPLVPTYNHT